MRRTPSPRLAGLLAGLVLGALITTVPAAAAAVPQVRLMPGHFGQTLRAPAGTVAATTSLTPTSSTQQLPRATAAPLSNWAVNYDATFQAHPQAQAAFQAAVDIWSHLVASSVTITVTAQSTGLDPGVLGQAGPTSYVALARDMQGGSATTYYPLALANAIVGRDLSSGSDITAQFDVSASDVYYGTDGQSAGKYDFETVVLHELGHGLGFLGSMDVDAQGYGFYGGGPQQPDPTVYDRFAMQSGGSIQRKRLVSYPSGTLALGSALTSGNVYWAGADGQAAYNGRPVRLYAPSSWEAASSYSHLSSTDFPPSDPNTLMTPFVGINEVIRNPGPVTLGMFADMGWTVPSQPGVNYTPISPVRVLDTRDPADPYYGRLGTGGVLDLTVAGGNTGVPSTATAVVLNVTGIGPLSATNVRVFPTPVSGTARPLASNLNVAAGDIRANLVTVPVGDAGRVRIYNSGGAINVLVDVQGWYDAAGSSLLEPTDPVRILDTRDGTGGVPVAPVGAGQSVDLTVTGGSSGVPTNATAVVLTVTAVHATATTDVRVYPTPSSPGTPPPQISSINLRSGQVVPNLVVAMVGAGGSVRLYNSAGSVDLVADLSGWYDDNPAGAAFHVLAPSRLLDTRLTAARVVTAGGVRDVTINGAAGIPRSGAVAVVLNVTGVDPSLSTDVAVYPTPTDGSVPLVSNLNLAPHQTAADLAVSRVGSTGSVRLRNSTGQLALVADIAGWFGS